MKIPEIIPPKTEVRLIDASPETPVWRDQIGREFRIGYYSPQDGLDCLWLVNEEGDYEQATDKEYLLKYFEILHLSDETDYFGEDRPVLGPLRSKCHERAEPITPPV